MKLPKLLKDANDPNYCIPEVSVNRADFEILAPQDSEDLEKALKRLELMDPEQSNQLTEIVTTTLMLLRLQFGVVLFCVRACLPSRSLRICACPQRNSPFVATWSTFRDESLGRVLC